MKKITLKISAILALAMLTFQMQGQSCPEVYLDPGTYKISTCGLTGELYMTINGATGQLEWADEITTSPQDATQLWTIQDHVNPASSGYIQITADLSALNAGPWKMVLDQSSLDDTGSDPEVRITAVPGMPISDTNDPEYGFDQFQRRRESGWGGPGNNALFVKPTPSSGALQGNLRYRDAPAAAGDDVLFQSPGAIAPLRMVFVAPLSNNQFEKGSVFISNPVKDMMTIESASMDINQIAVFDLLGRQVISSDLRNGSASTQLDVSALTKGVYIVKLFGDNGASFSQKIIKE